MNDFELGGDASMGYLAYTQDARMASLKSQSAHLFPKLGSQEASRGRDDYNRLGVLRTKPGRADSQPALSMSCSDKIAKWSVLGILGGFASRFLEPVYIENVVIGDFPHEKEENFRLREIIKRDCERALQARIGKVEGDACLGMRYSIANANNQICRRDMILVLPIYTTRISPSFTPNVSVMKLNQLQDPALNVRSIFGQDCKADLMKQASVGWPIRALLRS